MDNKIKVQLRGGFSDRHKISPLNNKVQINDLDKRTRNKIANLISHWYGTITNHELSVQFCKNLLNDVFGEYVSNQLAYLIEYENDDFIAEYLSKPLLNDSYDNVLTIIEYVSNFILALRTSYQNKYGFWQSCPFPDSQEEINNLFTTELVGYRMINGEITPITDDIELSEIQRSLDIQFEGCRSHIKKALNLLSNRESPDYKNSIKESISAVESICHIICKDKKATLGKALNRLEENGIKVHKALREAFCKLYGYASDEGGIRHAEGMFESNVSFEDAKYFLVSCCAFLNYLISACRGIVGDNDE